MKKKKLIIDIKKAEKDLADLREKNKNGKTEINVVIPSPTVTVNVPDVRREPGKKDGFIIPSPIKVWQRRERGITAKRLKGIFVKKKDHKEF